MRSTFAQRGAIMLAHFKPAHLWRAIALLALLSAVLAVSPASQQPPRKATQAEVAASLAHGAAWIWPNSIGPASATSGVAPYREAAVLVESLLLRADSVEHGGRTAPLALPAGVRMIPVVHVEAAADAPDAFTPRQVEAILDAVRRQSDAAARGVGVLQLDFEAPDRQRAAYRDLVAAVRAALPAEVRLSVTALAHWCFEGDWLDRLAADEVVPMLFRLGSHPEHWLRRFGRADSGAALRCRGPALGFATNDPPPSALLARASRPYWFDDSGWYNPSRPPPDLMP